MGSAVFGEFGPVGDRDCPGCAHWRRVLPHAPAGRSLGHPAAHRTVPAVAAPARQATDTGVCAGESRVIPQAPTHGPDGRVLPPGSLARASATGRADLVARARRWVARRVPRGAPAFGADGYWRDCSDQVPMTWVPSENTRTTNLGKFAHKSEENELRPGAIPLFPAFSDPYDGSPVALSGDGTDSARSVPYRCSAAVAAGITPPLPHTRTPFPGTAYFGPGAHNAYVREVGRTLLRRGTGRFNGAPPGPRWTTAVLSATRAFQEAQGWRGAVADGLPGPSTWELPTSGGGRDIPGGASASGPGEGAPAVASPGVPGCPGRVSFRPGAENVHVTRLGRQLVGPETWRRLFS